jgi:ribose transport system substrate-binding protein
LGAFAVSALLFAGCGGSDDGDSGDDAPKTASVEGGSLCVTALVSVGLVADYLDSYQGVADETGLKLDEKIANPEGDLAAALSNIDSCVRDKADAVVGIATENAAAAQSIKKAAKAGIPYIGDFSGKPVEGVAFNMKEDEAAASDLLFEFAEREFASGDDKPTALLINASPLPAVVARIGRFKELADQAGWNLEEVELDLANPAGSTTEKVSAALRSNSDISVIVSPWDDPTAGAVAALRQAQNEDTKVLSYDGLETTWAQMRTGNSPVVAVAAFPTGAFNDLRLWAIPQVIKGDIPAGTKAECVGPLVTVDNVPEEGERTLGGSCTVGKDQYSAEELTDLAGQQG